jgi:superfamily I DNA and/or RNA helicase
MISSLIQTLNFYTEDMRRKEDERISNLMKQLDIVAMTTTGACKYREQLRKVKSKIIVVEEAAEVLEAQIVSCLSKETEQLILIGDHLQLKPKVNSFTLSEEYGLSVSLFERLVSMGVPNVRLNQQRRMRPEIGDIVRLIYPGLKDHPSVSNFDDIRYGVYSILGED